MPSIDLFEAMHTQRAVRRYKPDPVPLELIRKVIDAAIRAPSATNRQPWCFVVIRDPDLRAKICAYYKKGWQEIRASPEVSARLDQEDQRVVRPAERFADHIREVPVLILICGIGLETYNDSLYPAAQNLMLAARGLGLGTVLTTVHRRYEKEIKLLLGIPPEVQAPLMVPMGYPAREYGPNRRLPVEEVTFLDRWGSRA